jgi:hypothetical protein
LRPDETIGEGAVGDRAFDQLDADRVVVDAQHTGGLAGSRAHATRHLGEVVGGVQGVDGTLGVAAVNVIVPVGDQVAERTAGIAERDAAVHAARALFDQLVLHDR